MIKGFGTACRIEVIPRDQVEEGKASFYFRASRAKIDTTALINYENNCLEIQGLGFDGRCSFCRYFRLNLKRQNIQVRLSCPFEVVTPDAGYQVRIGERFFDQAYLEDEENLKKAAELVGSNPKDLEAQLVMGAISEYHGQFADALSSYWKAFELDPQNSFARARLKEILEFLIELLPDD